MFASSTQKGLYLVQVLVSTTGKRNEDHIIYG